MTAKTKRAAEGTVLDAAHDYIARGWQPVPVPYKAKAPTKKGWQDLNITNENVEDYFDDDARQNIGVVLGGDSAGLVDVDLDCPEALALADVFLPGTDSVFGRSSKPRSHRLYVTDLCETESKAVIKYQETTALARDKDGAMLIELRIGAGAKGAQTIFPPSTHPSGESVAWDTNGEPSRVDGKELTEAVALLAAAALLVRHYPSQGSRHDAALVLGGLLARADWAEDLIVWFTEAVAIAAGDEEAKERAKAAASAVALLESEKECPGLPRMRELWGEGCADLFAKWIEYDANGTSRPGGKDDKKKQSDLIISLAVADAELFHSADGACFADVNANGHRETWPLTHKGTSGFGLWLRHKIYQATGGAPDPTAMATAMATLSAMALYDGPERDVHVRITNTGESVFLDLCDADWRVVEIDAKGWRLVKDAPVRFLRRAGMLALPVPVPHGSVESRATAFDRLYNYCNTATVEDFCLLVSFLLAALRGRGPYPALAIMGEPGSAKSTLERSLKQLLDPNKAPLRAPPRSTRDMFIAARNAYLIAFDNLSDLPGWVSDMLCRLATGGGFGTRQLYTDDDEILFDSMRPVVLTCVDNVIGRGDLTDRSIFLELKSIPEAKRRQEKDFWAAFERDRPAILGALLDVVSAGLREFPNVELESYPRMADFAQWATACEAGGGADVLWERGMFAAAYAMNRAKATQSAIEEDLVANAIRMMMVRRKNEPWRGSTKDLLGELNKIVDETVRQQKVWPKADNALGRRMNAAAGVLRRVGIVVVRTTVKGTNRRRWKIYRKGATKDGFLDK